MCARVCACVIIQGAPRRAAAKRVLNPPMDLHNTLQIIVCWFQFLVQGGEKWNWSVWVQNCVEDASCTTRCFYISPHIQAAHALPVSRLLLGVNEYWMLSTNYATAELVIGPPEMTRKRQRLPIVHDRHSQYFPA